MFLPNTFVLEVDTKAAGRLEATYSETPRDFKFLGVF